MSPPFNESSSSARTDESPSRISNTSGRFSNPSKFRSNQRCLHRVRRCNKMWCARTQISYFQSRAVQSHSCPEEESLRTDKRQNRFIWYTLSFHHLFKTWKDEERKEKEKLKVFDLPILRRAPRLGAWHISLATSSITSQ